MPLRALRTAAFPIALGAKAALLLAPSGLFGEENLGTPGAPLAGRVLGAEIRTADAEELRYYVLGRLTDRYAEAKGIAVAQAELVAWVDHVRATLAEDRARQTARRREIATKLAAGGLAEAERAALTAELERLDGFLAALSDPAEESEADRAARAEIAAAFIRQWKIHRELWRQYGGRIVYQQGGPEPLDAIRRFLEERQATGAFQILDRALEAAFWRYYRDDSLHSFYRPGSREEAEAFARPPWEEGGDASPRE